jgi:hypothetical protein
LGTRLLSQLPKSPAGLSQSLVERGQLGRSGKELLICVSGSYEWVAHASRVLVLAARQSDLNL